MFGFLKKVVDDPISFDSKFSSKEKDFLEEADEAYLMTFKQMDMKYFAKFASRTLYMNIYRTLSVDRPWAGVSNRFKKTKWSMVDESKTGFRCTKSTVFDKVNVTKQLKLSVADDYVELWYISKTDSGKLTVEDIKVC